MVFRITEKICRIIYVGPKLIKFPTTENEENELVDKIFENKGISLVCSVLREKCPNTGKYGPEKTPYLNSFHTVGTIDGAHIEIA